MTASHIRRRRALFDLGPFSWRFVAGTDSAVSRLTELKLLGGEDTDWLRS